MSPVDVDSGRTVVKGCILVFPSQCVRDGFSWTDLDLRRLPLAVSLLLRACVPGDKSPDAEVVAVCSAQ